MTIYGALVTGILALAGAVLGSWLSGRSAQKRGERELLHDRWGYWRKERLNAYIDFMSTVESWVTATLEYRKWLDAELKRLVG